LVQTGDIRLLGFVFVDETKVLNALDASDMHDWLGPPVVSRSTLGHRWPTMLFQRPDELAS
jgi:hypothetical protein